VNWILHHFCFNHNKKDYHLALTSKGLIRIIYAFLISFVFVILLHFMCNLLKLIALQNC